jgi:hypothetical protein
MNTDDKKLSLPAWSQHHMIMQPPDCSYCGRQITDNYSVMIGNSHYHHICEKRYCADLRRKRCRDLIRQAMERGETSIPITAVLLLMIADSDGPTDEELAAIKAAFVKST